MGLTLAYWVSLLVEPQFSEILNLFVVKVLYQDPCRILQPIDISNRSVLPLRYCVGLYQYRVGLNRSGSIGITSPMLCRNVPVTRRLESEW